MVLGAWLSLASICALGALSPGPSLALVVRHTLLGSRFNGVVAALSHGVGVGLYAGLTVAGLSVVITGSSVLFDALRYGGAAFLAYLGIRALVSATTAAAGLGKARGGEPGAATIRPWISARDAFLIAFLNPKIAVFFLALFSQFVRPEAGPAEKAGMALLAAGIDAAWYVVVALALSHSAMLERLRRRAGVLDRIFGVILIVLAVRVLLLGD